MKAFLFSSVVACVVLVDSNAIALSPEARTAIGREFGEVQLRNLVLAGAAASQSEPTKWNVYGIDPHRPGQVVQISVVNTNGIWVASPGAAGKLNRVPKQKLDFTRVKISSSRARSIAAQAAGLAQASFAKVDYQLAANEQTAVPEWGLGLKDATGFEIGFCAISAETGAVTFQNWTPKPAPGQAAKPDTRSRSERQAEEAAQKVKQGARKAWNWTEEAGRSTGRFFRELFR